MNFNPIRRSPIRRKPRIRREWAKGKVKEDARGMARLRSEAYQRSQGLCECGRPECEALPMRLRRVNWYDGQMHHLKPRSDVLDRVRFVKRECHEILTGKLQFGWYKKRPAA